MSTTTTEPAENQTETAAKAKHIIQLEDVCRVFHTDRMETRALNGIYLNIDEGDFLSISGPSGCGKSTLLSIIGLLDRSSSGRYLLEGQEVHAIHGRARALLRNRTIGFIFQNFNLIGEMNVAENVELPLVYRDVPYKQRKIMVKEALEQVEMDHREGHLPSQLSGGQQQRVAVARALVGKPRILLADEPTGNLDSKNGEAVMDLLCNLHQQGSTVCIVTHNEHYNSMVRRVVNLFDGRVVDDITKN
ncbi:MAG: ABC transporter ATP-binding protein [Opitutales bacterium]|nr:ABC transporter ATP-binding protein [Opitutales bacterium]